ncbi:MAG: F0F1 ATP synthase subunit A [Anaerovoracaceae bacterium]|jgi:F-type H+-transporting ATPase subunit a
MHSTEHLGPRKIIGFFDGQLFITETVLFGLIVAVIMIIFALISTRKMERYPKGIQLIAELIVEGIYSLTASTMGAKNAKGYAPYIGTLFIFLILCNAMGLFGFRPVTADVNMAFAMSTATFFIIQGTSIKNKGLLGHIKHYGEPYPFMYPIKIIEDISFPVSLAFRLFGNITGGMIIMALAFQGLHAITDKLDIGIPFFTFLIPLPLNAFFDIFEPVLQAFIFTMLTMAFVTLAIAGHEEH